MTSLISKLQSAETGNRELDVEVAKHLGGAIRWSHGFGVTRYQVMWLHEADHITQGMDPDNLPDVPEFTTSLDALVTLMEEKLPGWRRNVRWDDCSMDFFRANPKKEPDAYRVLAHIELFRPGLVGCFRGEHKSEILACLIAILKAMEIE